MEENTKKGFVYVLCDPEGTGLFKIGVTKGSIERRIKKLQTGDPNEIFIHTFFQTDDPYFFEKQLHFKYREQHVHGEWYDLDAEQLKMFKTYCEQIEEMKNALKDNPFFRKK